MWHNEGRVSAGVPVSSLEPWWIPYLPACWCQLPWVSVREKSSDITLCKWNRFPCLLKWFLVCVCGGGVSESASVTVSLGLVPTSGLPPHLNSDRPFEIMGPRVLFHGNSLIMSFGLLKCWMDSCIFSADDDLQWGYTIAVLLLKYRGIVEARFLGGLNCAQRYYFIEHK